MRAWSINGENGNEGIKISRDATIKKGGRRRGVVRGEGAMHDCWGRWGDNDEAASVSTVGPGSTRRARASVTPAVMGPPSSSTTMTRHGMQGGDEDVWQAIFDDD